MNKFLFLIVLIFIGETAHAIQEFQVKNGDTISVKISSNEVNRISIEGDSKLLGIRNASNRLIIQSNQNGKDVFIQPHPSAPKNFSFFITDTKDNTYTIVATQQNIPAESIILKPKKIIHEKAFEKYYQSMPHINHVKTLIKNMALGKSLNGYDIASVDKTVKWWKESSVRHLDSYIGMHMVGERYLLKNISEDVMYLDESEISVFRKDILAVSIEFMTLNPNETTPVYIIRKNDRKVDNG